MSPKKYAMDNLQDSGFLGAHPEKFLLMHRINYMELQAARVTLSCPFLAKHRRTTIKADLDNENTRFVRKIPNEGKIIEKRRRNFTMRGLMITGSHYLAFLLKLLTTRLKMMDC